MSAFEDFVQQELPKRGYLNTDVAQETIIVRRGAGPRQFDAVQLAEGQVLALVNGVLKGVAVSDSSIGGNTGLRKAVQTFTNQTDITVAHNLNSQNVIIQVFDNSGYVLIPDVMRIVDANNVEIVFNSSQSGTVRVVFLD